MARRHAIISEENNFRIPEDAFTFEGFQRWMDSGDFPATGRIDYLGGDIEVDMSPEDLFTHGAPKTAITSKLHVLVAEAGRGFVFTDSTRLGFRFSELSTEPDVVVALRDSVESGKVRLNPSSSRKGPGRYSGLDGAADLVVEIISDSSVRKDTERLPLLYAQAGVPELWLVDARGEEIRFNILALRKGCYEMVEPDADGWTPSLQLGCSFRLARVHQPWLGSSIYKLEHR